MELLASDMITRALLIASRKNFGHAARILKETIKIVETVADGLKQSSLAARSRREIAVGMAYEGLEAVIADLEMLSEGLEEHKELFERDHRNYAAQQVRFSLNGTDSRRLYCEHKRAGPFVRRQRGYIARPMFSMLYSCRESGRVDDLLSVVYLYILGTK